MDQLDRSTQAVATGLDGCIMTREELIREVDRISSLPAAKPAWGWGTLLKPATFTGRYLFRLRPRRLSRSRRCWSGGGVAIARE